MNRFVCGGLKERERDWEKGPRDFWIKGKGESVSAKNPAESEPRDSLRENRDERVGGEMGFGDEKARRPHIDLCFWTTKSSLSAVL